MPGRDKRYPQHRGLVMARGGMVSAAHPLVTAAGLQVLRAGGTAADAAVAAAAVCGVVLSGKCGLGGDMFCLYYNASDRQVTGFNGSGAAGSGATIEEMRRRGASFMPQRGPMSVTVPGAVHGYHEVHRRFGRLPWNTLFEEAIRHAEQGHPVAERTSGDIASAAHVLTDETEWRRIYLSTGRAPEPGEVLAQPDLAASLRQVSENGPEAFYTGDLARRIAATLRERGGFVTEDDLAAHTTEVYAPISTTYRGLTVFETQPPSQGFIVLEMLNLLEGFDLAAAGFGSAEAIHLMVEAKKLAFADRWAFMGDPRHVDAPTAELTSKRYAEERRRAIDPDRANARALAGTPRAVPADTTSFCVVDGEGNAASFIHTLYAGMGSGVAVPGTGIVLTNRGYSFSLDEQHSNALAPGKRPMHTLNCYIVTDGDELALVGNTPGGDSQPQWNVQTLTKLFDFGMNVQQAVETPEWVSTPGTEPPTIGNAYELQLEAGFSEETVAQLERMGHSVRQVDRLGFGSSNMLIRRDPASGVLSGGADPRSDGCSMGF